jgi:Flp pilus assembly protein TadG
VTRRNRHGDRGEANVLGLVLIAPVAVAVGIMILWIGRQVDTDAQMQAASSAAAQAAARQRNPVDGQAAAQQVAAAMLTDATACSGGASVSIDSSAWAPGGSVTVTVTCAPRVDDLALGGASKRTFTASSTATIDRYRSAGLP